MKGIRATQMFMDICSGRLGIRTRHAEEALEQPAATSKLSAEGLQVRICSRPIASDPPHTLVVLASEKVPGEVAIDFGYKAYPDLQRDLERATPLELTRRLAERFGVEMQIGDQRKKLFVEDKVTVDDRDPRRYLRIANERDHRLAPLTYLRTESHGAHLRASCLLCFCIDITEYEAWLTAQRG
ncbi:MAG: hypothetical protein JXR83_05210 [Deltaproteobacteria bacterium]|nr:hypothetical protein [Deltaproteobacteria bacterium]